MCAGVYSSHTHLYGSFALKYNGLLNSFIIIQMKSGPQQIVGIQIVLDIQCIPVGQSQWTVCFIQLSVPDCQCICAVHIYFIEKCKK